MSKKVLSILMLAIMTFTVVISGCTSEKSGVKVGMVTDSGTIDDKSFNQGTWEGIQRYKEENGADENYIQPGGEAKTDYLTAISDLVDGGYNLIITPGFKFEEAIFDAQAQYPETSFVIIDGTPIPEAYAYDQGVVGDNTVSIFFAEHEAGFLAGVAAALESQTGQVGFIGGMEIPAVQKFGWGFVAGVAYANDNYGTNVNVSEYIYQGTFTEVEAGKTLAGNMYNNGVDIVFAAAGGVGIGAINEAKERAVAGEEVYVVGVDVDQYADGIYEGENSAVLTSAMKRVDQAAYDYIKLYEEGNFPGGETVILDIKNGGVGLPDENPNLSSDTITKADETKSKMVAGDVVVPDSLDSLTSFLSDYNYTTPEGIEY